MNKKLIIVTFLIIAVLAILPIISVSGSGSPTQIFISRSGVSSQEVMSRDNITTPVLIVASGSLSIDLDITTWEIGSVNVSETKNTGLDYYTMTNDGDITCDITVNGTDMTGIGTTWTLSDTATAGDAIYGLKAGLTGESYNVIVRKSATYNTLVYNLIANGTQEFGLELYTPTANIGGVEVTGTVTLTASLAT